MGILNKVAHELFHVGNVAFTSVWTDSSNDTYMNDSVNNPRDPLDVTYLPGKSTNAKSSTP